MCFSTLHSSSRCSRGTMSILERLHQTNRLTAVSFDGKWKFCEFLHTFIWSSTVNPSRVNPISRNIGQPELSNNEGGWVFFVTQQWMPCMNSFYRWSPLFLSNILNARKDWMTWTVSAMAMVRLLLGIVLWLSVVGPEKLKRKLTVWNSTYCRQYCIQPSDWTLVIRKRCQQDIVVQK